MEPDRCYKDILKEIFPGRSDEHIQNIIQIVEENNYIEDPLEEMIIMLAESGDSALYEAHGDNPDEAAGFGYSSTGNFSYYDFLENLFPKICPYFLRKFCEEKCQRKILDLNEIVDELLKASSLIRMEQDFLFPIQTVLLNSKPSKKSGGYVLKGNKADTIFEQLSDIIPDADPDYLRSKAGLLAEKSAEELEKFIELAIEKHDYPNKRDYYKRQKSISEARSYTVNFSVEDYLDEIPDPFEHFNSSYVSVLCSDDTNQVDENHAATCLLNLFPYLREKDIKKLFHKYKKNIIKASDALAKVPRHFKTPRRQITLEDDCENIQLLQEIAFVKHKKQLKFAIKMKDSYYRLAREEAEKFGLLETCQCCFFEGLLPEECYFCRKNCPFCKECVAKGAEHVIGKGEIIFPCLSNCNSEFDISTLKMVLDKKTFDPLFTRIQNDEVKRANIDGLETCPYCDFSMILSDQEKIFKCQNIECMEESCRECRQKSHVPLRCNEIEYDEDVKRRTYIENKMTEALVRTCWKCQKPFFKESGCNKMACPCGAKMCYCCGKAINGYEHFGATSDNKCPLYTDDLKAFHAQRIINSANTAKNELGINNNPKLLKKDPTEGLQEYSDGL